MSRNILIVLSAQNGADALLQATSEVLYKPGVILHTAVVLRSWPATDTVAVSELLVTIGASWHSGHWEMPASSKRHFEPLICLFGVCQRVRPHR
jgi:hypothetical protein